MPKTRVLYSFRALGLAEFFGEGFAVGEGDSVEAVENCDVEGEGGDRKGEQYGDHQPGAIEMVGQDEGGVACACAGYENSQGDEDAQLGGLPAAGFCEIDLLGGGEGAEVAGGAVDECGEEKPADR